MVQMERSMAKHWKSEMEPMHTDMVRSLWDPDLWQAGMLLSRWGLRHRQMAIMHFLWDMGQEHSEPHLWLCDNILPLMEIILLLWEILPLMEIGLQP